MSRETIGRPSGLVVIGWKYPPQAWWPELPGKAGEYNPPMAKSFKKVCRACRKVEVKGLKRYCKGCARTRNRAAYRMSKAKSRSRVQKTGFSPVAAEALTKANMTSGYGGSGIPYQAKINLDLKEHVT